MNETPVITNENEPVLPAWPEVRISTYEGTGKPHLEWEAQEGAEAYEVYRSRSASGQYYLIWTVTEPQYTNTSAVPGETYYYQIRPVIEGAEPSTVAFITCDCARPVVSIRTDAMSGQPELTWDRVTGADKYEIYRSSSRNGHYTRMWTVTDTHYRNTSAEPGETYYYRVKARCAVSSYGDSALSRAVYITCDCQRPAASVHIDAASGKPMISWDPVPFANAYEVFRSGTSGGKYYSFCVLEEGTECMDEKAKPGLTYFYKVRAKCERSAYGDSALSVEAYITCDCARPVAVLESDTETGAVLLVWEPIEGAARYEISRATQPDGTFHRLAVTEETRYVLPAMGKDPIYYRVSAISERTTYADSAPSEPVKAIVR